MTTDQETTTQETKSQQSQSQETIFRVEGMRCGSCVRHVNQALRELDGVQDVEVHLREGQVLVTHAGASPEAMLQALRDAGYTSRLAGEPR